MPYLPVFAFAAIYAAAAFTLGVPHAVGLAYAGASVACFVAYALDKSAARAGERRTPESTLLLLGLLCGWPGAVLAQQWLRHKTAKASFRTPFYATVAVNLGAFAWLVSPVSPLRPF